MTDLAPNLSKFLNEHLVRDQRASPHTIASYSLAFERFVAFAAKRLKTRPIRIAVQQLSVPLILDFLDQLEKEQGNSIRTRNLRLVAIKSFFRYLEFRVPACLELAQQVHAIPAKRFVRGLVKSLDMDEVQAILDAPDTGTVNGVRDRAMLLLTYAAGLRVSEAVGLKLQDLGHNLATVHVMGKGRRERVMPVWGIAQSVLKEWLAIRPDGPDDHLFLNGRGKGMTRHGFAHRLEVHATTASRKVPSLVGRKVSPHVLRHACAIHTLDAVENDLRKVSLYLGHASLQSTETYTRGDPVERLNALSNRVPPQIRKGRFRKSSDPLMAMLGDLKRA